MHKGITYAIIGIVMLITITALITGCTSTNQAGQAAYAGGEAGKKCPSNSEPPCNELKVNDGCGVTAGDGTQTSGICRLWSFDINDPANRYCLCR